MIWALFTACDVFLLFLFSLCWLRKKEMLSYLFVFYQCAEEGTIYISDFFMSGIFVE